MYSLLLLTSLLIADGEKKDEKATLSCYVVKVKDGDTFDAMCGETKTTVRLARIDAPENKQDYGKESGEYLSKLVASKLVEILVVNKDMYGRFVAEVFVSTTTKTSVNEEMVKSGNAWVYTDYCREKIMLDYEDKARTNKLGLWKADKPTPPWVFRKQEKTKPMKTSKPKKTTSQKHKLKGSYECECLRQS